MNSVVGRVGVILSGQYVEPELARDFGSIPPSFLPIGEKRLYESQVEELAKSATTLLMTVPSSYEVPEFDRKKLESLNVEIIKTPTSMKIRESLIHIIEGEQRNGLSSLVVIYGDTLGKFTNSENVIYVESEPNFYNWGKLKGGTAPKSIESYSTIVGLFKFSSIEKLLVALNKSESDIVSIVEEYAETSNAELKKASNWLDFGHRGTYFESRKSIQQSRHFNSIKVIGNSVFKTSHNLHKMECEYKWYKNLPEEMSIFVPRITGSTVNGYSTEYLKEPTLQELLVFSELASSVWGTILLSIIEYLETSIKLKTSDRHVKDVSDFKGLSILKSKKRFKEINFKDLAGYLNIDPEYLEKIAIKAFQGSIDEVSNWDGMREAILHGDMCATNIFWNSQDLRIKLIDPRAQDHMNQFSNHGNIAYDVAKLYQSFVLNYEYIICGRYALEGDQETGIELVFNKSSEQKAIENLFLEKVKNLEHFEIKKIHHLSCLLIFSLIPLHSDRVDRQCAFLIHAINSSREGDRL